MPCVDVTVECPVHDSFRVQQVAGLFDVPLRDRATERFRVEMPELGDDWKIGLIVGPSGSGKTTIARRLFAGRMYQHGDWPQVGERELENNEYADCEQRVAVSQQAIAIEHIRRYIP